MERCTTIAQVAAASTTCHCRDLRDNGKGDCVRTFAAEVHPDRREKPFVGLRQRPFACDQLREHELRSGARTQHAEIRDLGFEKSVQIIAIAREVVEPQLPVRRAPSPDAPLDTEALLGERVTVFETSEEGWAWGQLDADRYVGFMPANGLAPPGPAPTHRVGAVRTLMFPGPSIKLPPLAGLAFGAVVAVAREENRFAVTASGGYVPRVHLAPIERLETCLDLRSQSSQLQRIFAPLLLKHAQCITDRLTRILVLTCFDYTLDERILFGSKANVAGWHSHILLAHRQ